MKTESIRLEGCMGWPFIIYILSIKTKCYEAHIKRAALILSTAFYCRPYQPYLIVLNEGGMLCLGSSFIHFFKSKIFFQMKTFKFFLPVALIVALFVLVLSCNKEPKIQPQLPQTIAPTEVAPVDIQIDQAKLNEVQALAANMVATRSPISYVGRLCPGVTHSDDAVKNGINNSATWDYYYFYGCAGDGVTIVATRTGSCQMDPATSLYAGITADNTGVGTGSGGPDMTFLAFADDNTPQSCSPGFCFSDPTTFYVLPADGVYTIAVYDFISCAGVDLTYDLTVTGIPDCNIVIDGCDSGVPNKLIPAGGLMSCAIDACAAAAGNHGQFVSCVAALTNAWKAAGLITGAQKGAIQSCAAGANIP
jgi:hypothetical protein